MTNEMMMASDASVEIHEGGAAGDGATKYPATDSNESCQATVAQGALMGKASGATCEYLGIPYGAPPIGSLRFMPPQKAAGWASPRDATSFGHACMQATSSLSTTKDTSEDCLSVNVFTPKAAPPGPLPVMAFIYGGAFTSGASSLYPNAQVLSERGPVVVVTLNYRLGALGFLALPELDAKRPGAPSGSDGIRDQQLALRWVHDNIATFHGDPANVTVFGESAGGTSTCIHVVSPGSRGLANRFIIESGLCNGIQPEVTTQAKAYQIGQQLVGSFCGGNGGSGDGGASDAGLNDAAANDAGLNDGGASDAPTGDGGSSAGDGGVSDPVACLQAADAMAVVTWSPPAGGAGAGSGMLLGSALGPPFSPTVEGPGGVLPDLPANLIKQGSFKPGVEVLAGTNKNEFGLFVDLVTNPIFGGSSSATLNVTTAAQLKTLIDDTFGANASAVEAEYPATDATAAQVLVDLFTDFSFRCPARDLARAMLANGAKSYYLYSYDIGKAWHSFELVPLFNLADLIVLGATDPSAAFSEEMRGYWTRFAATGNPNAPGDSSAPAWPLYSTSGGQYLTLVDPTPMMNAHLRDTQCDFWAAGASASP